MDPREKEELDKWAAEKEAELAEEASKEPHVRVRIAVDKPAATLSPASNDHAWKITVPCVIRHGDEFRLTATAGLRNRLGARNLNFTIHAPTPEEALTELERRLGST